MSIDCISDQLANLHEADFTRREGGNGGLVGGIEHRAQGPPLAGDIVSQAEGGKTLWVRLFKIQG